MLGRTVLCLLKGSTLLSFFSRTCDAIPTSRSILAVSGVSIVFSGAFSGIPVFMTCGRNQFWACWTSRILVLTLLMRFKIFLRRRSRSCSVSLPQFSARVTCLPRAEGGPGISMSKPALMDSAAEYVPNLMNFSNVKCSSTRIIVTSHSSPSRQTSTHLSG